MRPPTARLARKGAAPRPGSTDALGTTDVLQIRELFFSEVVSRCGYDVTPREGPEGHVRRAGARGISRPHDNDRRPRSAAVHPAPGASGARTIVAQVQLDGLPNERPTVARFTATDPQRPACVRHLRLRRRRAAVTVRWQAVPRARAYRVVLTLRNGDRTQVTTRAAVRRLRVPATQAGTVTIVAVDALGTTGRPASRRFRAVRRAALRFQRYRP